MSHLKTRLSFPDAGDCCPFSLHCSRAAPKRSRMSSEGRTARGMGQAAPTVASMGNDAEAPESLRQKSLATRMLHPPKVTQDPYGAVAPPLYQTATFDQVSAVQCGPYDYTRSEDPTRDQLEAQIADLEGTARSFAFASGMAVLAVVLRLVMAGQHEVA